MDFVFKYIPLLPKGGGGGGGGGAGGGVYTYRQNPLLLSLMKAICHS